MNLRTPAFVSRLDNPEPLFPGEQWVDLAAGLAAWWLTRKNPSYAVRTLGVVVGASLVARSARGHQALGEVLRFTPVGGAIKRDHDDVV